MAGGSQMQAVFGGRAGGGEQHIRNHAAGDQCHAMLFSDRALNPPVPRTRQRHGHFDHDHTVVGGESGQQGGQAVAVVGQRLAEEHVVSADGENDHGVMDRTGGQIAVDVGDAGVGEGIAGRVAMDEGFESKRPAFGAFGSDHAVEYIADADDLTDIGLGRVVGVQRIGAGFVINCLHQ